MTSRRPTPTEPSPTRLPPSSHAARRDPTRPMRRPRPASIEDTQPDMRAIPLGRSPRTSPDLRALDVEKLPPWALRGQPEGASAVERVAELDAATVTRLEELVRTQIVSANYLLSASRSARTQPLQLVLEAAAEQRRAHASVLRSVLALDVIPERQREDRAALGLLQELAVSGFARSEAELVRLVAGQERAVQRVLERACERLGDSPTRDTVEAQLAFTVEQVDALDQLVAAMPPGDEEPD